MHNQILSSILAVETANTITIGELFACTLCSLVLGAVIAAVYQYQNCSSRNFVITLALLPTIIQMVIMLVNGNLGTGVAVMGAFSLVRFRSAPGGSKEIGSIFLTMAVGLATGMGYIALAVLFAVVIEGISLLYMASGFGKLDRMEKELKITIPEGLDYIGIFDDLFSRFTKQCELVKVSTSNMGSLYKLDYHIVLKDADAEKEFIDELRCRNGNLEITCGRKVTGTSEL